MEKTIIQPLTDTERKLGRAENYHSMSSEEQWQDDKKNKILDWGGGEDVILKVRHQELKRLADTQSGFRSHCPKCSTGILFVHRDPQTMKLLALDQCIVCAQRFFYTDLKEEIYLQYTD